MEHTLGPETQTQTAPVLSGNASAEEDYSYVSSSARVALYDDLRSAPRIVEIAPAATAEYIDNIATAVYDYAQRAGGSIPYTVIREVTENFIHAHFREIVVSVFDQGNTIRFSDQGPGIEHKEQATQPGFSSATAPMKQFIRGVGSGLPIVKEYVEFSHGRITIEDNLGTGSVVTISMVPACEAGSDSAEAAQETARQEADSPAQDPSDGTYNQEAYEAARVNMTIPLLSRREREFLSLFLHEEPLGVTDLSKLTNSAASSTHHALMNLEEQGLVERLSNKKRILTTLGKSVAAKLESMS